MQKSIARPLLFKRILSSRTTNILTRLASLGAKLIFTLYLGRYLGLSEIGTYGLITAYVAVLVNVLGFSLDFVVAREIVDASPIEVSCKIRDQSVFNLINYILLFLLITIAAWGPLKDMHKEILLFIFILSVLEHFAAVTSVNFISLNKPVLANILFFIRAASWTLPAMAMGILSFSFRNADTVIWLWISGILVSLAVTIFVFRTFPWRAVWVTPVDWRWIGSGIRKCSLIWLGSVGGMVASYVDRFVVEHYMGLKYVGIVSFYASFVVAIGSLMHSGVFAFSYPRLISFYRKHEDKAFKREVWVITLQAMLFASFVGMGVGIVVPYFGVLLHRSEFTEYKTTLWLMLAGIWLRCAVDSLYYALYARQEDRMISLGELLMLVPALSCNMLLVPRFGLLGVGYSAICVAVFICIWRVVCIRLSYGRHRASMAM